MPKIPMFVEKDQPLFRLHYAVITAIHLYLLISALTFSHPIYLLALLAVVAAMFVSSHTWSAGKFYLSMTIPLMLLIIIINLLFSRAGTSLLWETTLWGSFNLPFTWEALTYGGLMALRLLIIVSTCTSFFTLLSPARMLHLMSVFGQRWALTFNLTLRLLPLMMEEHGRITEVQRCRGVENSAGSLVARIKSVLPSLSILLLSSLERSVEMAESMYSRGYGSGPRTSYHQEVWTWASTLAGFNLAGVLAISGLALIKGWGSYSIYPTLTTINWINTWPALLIFAGLLIPCLGQGGEKAADAEFTESQLYLSGKPTT